MPSPSGWIPSTAWGSLCESWTSRSICCSTSCALTGRLSGGERPDRLYGQRVAGVDLRNRAAGDADRLIELAKQVLAPAHEILADDRLGSEGGIGRIRGEGGVHLADAGPELADLVER